jgi:hypothetical protein
MNVILDILDRYQSKPSRKLHIQLDNCFRENKNKYVLSLGWMIVHLGIFDEVRILGGDILLEKILLVAVSPVGFSRILSLLRISTKISMYGWF